MRTLIKKKTTKDFFKKLIIKNRAYLLTIFFFGLIIDIFFYPVISDLIVILLASLWIASIFNYRLKTLQSILLAVISYLIAFILQFFGNEMIMEKGASWFFVFLSLAVGQGFIEEFFKRQK